MAYNQREHRQLVQMNYQEFRGSCASEPRENSTVLVSQFPSRTSAQYQHSHILNSYVTNHALHHFFGSFIILATTADENEEKETGRTFSKDVSFAQILALQNLQGKLRVKKIQVGILSLTCFIYNKKKKSTAKEVQWKTELHDMAGLILEEIFAAQAVLLKRTGFAGYAKPIN